MCIPDYASMETEELIPRYGEHPEIRRVLIDRYGREVSAVCRHNTYRREDAEDAAQETWLAIERGYGTFGSGGRGSGRTWVRRVARNAVISVWRKSRRHFEGRVYGADLDSVVAKEECEAMSRIAELLPALTPQYQVALMLTDPRCQGSGSNPGQDVALLLTINRPGVTTEVADALAALRKLYYSSF